MNYLFVVGALIAGVGLVAAGVATAIFFTTYSYSVFDVLLTAFTGITLQVGNVLIVGSVTVIAFDVLSLVGSDHSILVQVVVGYALFHLVCYRSSIVVTDLQSRPLDPDLSGARDRLASVVRLPTPLQSLAADLSNGLPFGTGKRN